MKAARVVLPLALLLFGACAWWIAGRPGLEQDQLIFSHALHKENGLECDTCHAGVKDATDVRAWHSPKEATCTDCHERDNCSQCHTDVALRKEGYDKGEQDPNLTFSHAAHVARADSCATCHVASETGTSLPLGRPSMEVCLTCHNHKADYAEARCTKCHATMRNVPLRAVAEFEHDGNWMSRHGLAATSQGADCLQCHQQSSCTECHSRVAPATNAKLFPEQVQKTLLHRGDFISTHAMEARADGATCERCHQAPNFCADCHRAQGVGVGVGVTNTRIHHPAGYAVRGGGPVFHGDDARLHIETCVSCHDQGAQSNCVSCHKVGGVGGSPHPKDWSLHNTLGDANKQAMCKVCHQSAP